MCERLFNYLLSIGYEIEGVESKNISGGSYKQIKFKNTAMIINCYETGTINIQGKHSEEEREFFEKFIKSKKYENIDEAQLKLNKKIVDLINKGKETEVSDFKESYNPEKKDCFVKDILSLANNMKFENAYLIYGVSDDNEVKGVKGRLKQNNIIDLLSNVPFASKAPDIKVENLNYKHFNIDVILIEHNKNVPFYLSKNYRGVPPFVIYTRCGDVNSNAKFEEVESLWKHRLGYDDTVLSKFYDKLKNLKNWEHGDGINSFYCTKDPDFKIIFNQDTDFGYCYYYLLNRCFGEKGRMGNYDLNYKGTSLKEGKYFTNGIYDFILPNEEVSKGIKYAYFIENDGLKSLYALIYNIQINDLRSRDVATDEIEKCSKHILESILTFKDKKEKDEFDEYLVNQNITIDLLLEDTSINTSELCLDLLPEYYDKNQYRKDYIVSTKLISLLEKMRKTKN